MALRIYGVVLVAIVSMRAAIWLYATNRTHLLWQQLDDRQRRAGLALTVVPGLVYLVALLVAGVVPTVRTPALDAPGQAGLTSIRGQVRLTTWFRWLQAR